MTSGTCFSSHHLECTECHAATKYLSTPSSVSAGRTDVCDGVPSASAAGVFLHAAGVAVRFHRITGALPVCPGATDMVEEVRGCSQTLSFLSKEQKSTVCVCVLRQVCRRVFTSDHENHVVLRRFPLDQSERGAGGLL